MYDPRCLNLDLLNSSNILIPKKEATRLVTLIHSTVKLFTKALFGMAPTPNSTPELNGASQAPQLLQKLMEQPNSMELVEP